RGWQEKSVTHAAVFPLVAVLIAAAVAAAILIVTSAQNDDYDSGGAVSGRGGGGGSGIGSPSIPLSLTIAIVCCCCCCFGGVAVAAADLPSDFAHAVAASQLDDACLDAAECQVAKGQGRLGCRPTTKEVGRAGGSSDRCLCIRGFEFYAPSGSCVECSRECPSGQFLVAECTPHRDIVCQDAVRPLSKEDNRLKDEDFKPVSEAEAATFKSVHSNNLIAEKSLLKWRSHTVPLSGNGVTKQFVWAGSHPDLEVRLWVKDANLIPTYIDGNKKRADGRDASDNEFMSHLISYYSRKWQHLKAPRVYSSIMKNYCRQPVPLHYKVTLRRKKRVFSELHRISCSSPVEIDGIVYTCPPEYLPDDYYISRKLTSPCYKQNTLYTKYSRLGNYNPYSVSDLKLGVKLRRNSPNVLYCGWTTDLLSKLFNMTTEPERTATPAFDEAGLEPCQDFAANCLACRAEKFDNCDSRRN
uniref:TNFR-Cys domain-containing protein n=1 Tax=Macrostomum lignano TaxID=282301 RepID=A0A1I8I6U3_9PLAT